MVNIIGSFKTKEQCITELKIQGFIWHTKNIYINKSTSELAEIHVYKDFSASVLIGKYKNSLIFK